VWRQPTWYHLIALPDFLHCVQAAIEGEQVAGIYNLGDEAPITLQQFLSRAAAYWGCPKPWTAPKWLFYFAAWWVEAYASLFRTSAPLTRDFIKIGMASHVSDITRMKSELIPELLYPSLDQGIELL
jgi:NAD dependent epimerase/dehydratase family enzyme